MTGKKIFVVITAFNRWTQTRECLQHLLSGTDTGHAILVVDHGTDGCTREGLVNEFPDVIRIQGDPEMWWTAATNLGIRTALDRGADAVMLLNNDCYVDRDMLQRLRQHLEQAGESVIAPVQRSLQTGTIRTKRMTTCLLLGFTTLTFPWGDLHRPGEQRLLPTGLIVGGRGVLIPSSVFGTVGLLNESDLPQYGSDHDFYLRCRKQGIPLYIAGNALVDVDEDTTSLATRLGGMSARQFLRSLHDRHSHRNLQELSSLFRLHYPVPLLYPLGVALNLTRYSLSYALLRLLHVTGWYRPQPDKTAE